MTDFLYIDFAESTILFMIASGNIIAPTGHDEEIEKKIIPNINRIS